MFGQEWITVESFNILLGVKKHENQMFFISGVMQVLINVMETCQIQYTRL